MPSARPETIVIPWAITGGGVFIIGMAEFDGLLLPTTARQEC